MQAKIDELQRGSGSSSQSREGDQQDEVSIPQTQAAKDARLRRICERKPSGKLHVLEEVHKQWVTRGPGRDQLLAELEACNWNKDLKLLKATQPGRRVSSRR